MGLRLICSKQTKWQIPENWQAVNLMDSLQKGGDHLMVFLMKLQI